MPPYHAIGARICRSLACDPSFGTAAGKRDPKSASVSARRFIDGHYCPETDGVPVSGQHAKEETRFRRGHSWDTPAYLRRSVPLLPQAMASLAATDRAALIPGPAAALSAAPKHRLANGRLRRMHDRSRSSSSSATMALTRSTHPAGRAKRPLCQLQRRESRGRKTRPGPLAPPRIPKSHRPIRRPGHPRHRRQPDRRQSQEGRETRLAQDPRRASPGGSARPSPSGPSRRPPGNCAGSSNRPRPNGSPNCWRRWRHWGRRGRCAGIAMWEWAAVDPILERLPRPQWLRPRAVQRHSVFTSARRTKWSVWALPIDRIRHLPRHGAAGQDAADPRAAAQRPSHRAGHRADGHLPQSHALALGGHRPRRLHARLLQHDRSDVGPARQA